MQKPHNLELSGAMSPLEAALAYAARGLRVFPVESVDARGNCTCGRPPCSTGKHPIGGLAPRGLKDASTDPAVIASWWARRPDASPAIATGRESGIVVLDIDPGKGGDESLAALEVEHGPLPPCPSVRTGGGGRHLYFAYPTEGVEIRNSASALAPGLDVRGEGGYVVAPPARHASGGVYSWEIGLHHA